MKKISLFTFLFFAFAYTFGQDYKIAKTSGRLEIHLGNVTVEPTSGNEIIFSSKDKDRDDDDRAKGLVAVSGLGLEDNTHLGINVTTKGDAVVVQQLQKTQSPEIRIQVPKGVIVAYDYESQYGDDAEFKNLENELEINAQYNKIVLENITGPVTCKTIYSEIEATFSQNVKGPVSLISIYSDVDVTMPGSLKADISMKTSYGAMYTSPDFKIDQTGNTKEGSMVEVSPNKVVGKIGGGGMKLDLRSDYSKIYLRKAK